jgi:hypothetical protein
MGDVKPLWGRRWPFLGMISIQEAKRWPLWASCKLPHVPQGPSTLPHPLGNVHPALVASCPSKPSYHLQGLVPHRSNLYQSVLMRMSFFFSMQGLVITLSCVCHPSNHLMGSSAPWRSELIISPCAPILWYLSTGYGLAHQRLRPPWAHQS